jgi:hypothetical protein
VAWETSVTPPASVETSTLASDAADGIANAQREGKTDGGITGSQGGAAESRAPR